MKKSIFVFAMMVMCFVLSTVSSNVNAQSSVQIESESFMDYIKATSLTPALDKPVSFSSPDQQKKPRTVFKMAWSIYAGWNPWEYARVSGILDKWAKKYGIQIILERMEYGPSIDAFMTPSIDVVVMTNMDALLAPVTGGVDCTVVINGDFSNGNDAMIVKGNKTLNDLNGMTMYLVEKTVSEYLIFRAEEIKQLNFSLMEIKNTTEAEINGSFITSKDMQAVTTWNPWVMNVMKNEGMINLFNSSQIPGEILDLAIVKTSVLNQYPALGKALVGAWYEVMSIMSSRTSASSSALNTMAQIGGSSLTDYMGQLKTTAMFYTPKEAADYTESQEMKEKMLKVRNFCFKRGWLGEIKSPNEIGIQFSSGVVGDPNKVLFRFDTKFMRMAERGEL